ncbi:MAG: TRAP transporter small permease subunit [Gammaproteobacteria bacterium]|nr:TRAP transporter small permease subunit [Gammaproteobacteria bacterium]
MMLVTVIVVVARYGFGQGTIPLQEGVIYMHAIVFMLGIAYTLKTEDHVRVDILYQRFPPRVRGIVDLAGTVLFLFPISFFIFWTSLDYVSLSWRMGEGSAEPGGLPAIYLLKTLIPLMAALLALQGVAEVLRACQRILHPHG